MASGTTPNISMSRHEFTTGVPGPSASGRGREMEGKGEREREREEEGREKRGREKRGRKGGREGRIECVGEMAREKEKGWGGTWRAREGREPEGTRMLSVKTNCAKAAASTQTPKTPPCNASIGSSRRPKS